MRDAVEVRTHPMFNLNDFSLQSFFKKKKIRVFPSEINWIWLFESLMKASSLVSSRSEAKRVLQTAAMVRFIIFPSPIGSVYSPVQLK